MPRTTYNKLVRDKIGDIITKRGGTAKISVLSKPEFRVALKSKLLEEAKELFEAMTDVDALEELADILEVMAAIAGERGMSMVQVEMMRWKKAEERGAFDRQLFLEYVDDEVK